MPDEPRRVPRELPCRLTDTERLELGDQLASALTEHDDKQEEKRKITADQKPIKKLITALQKKLKAGTEQRTIICEVHEGPGHNIKIVRTDNGLVVEERAMTPEERQAKLAGGDWLGETEKAAARGKAGSKGAAAAGGDEDDEGELDDDDQDDARVIPFGGRTTTKKAARSPRKGGGKGKGRKR